MTREQILLLNRAVRALRGTSRQGYSYIDGVARFDIANLLVQLEREIKALQKQLEEKVELYDECVADASKLQKERDAAVKELYGKCPYCINYTPNGFIKCFNLATCKHIGNGGADDNWQWRGVQEVE